MSEKISLGLDFDLAIRDIASINPSFDVASIAIAYAGRNRNYSSISKEVFEKALPTLANVPLVGRYIPEEKDFGAHDIRVRASEDDIEIVNATTPFGVIPESANQWWETIREADGSEREYLFTECILWKRQEGYETLKSQDRWNQSMEISCNSYVVDNDGYYVVDDFNFEALCILGKNVEPCFESAMVQVSERKSMFSYSSQFGEMLKELREIKYQTDAPLESKDFEEGGETDLAEEEKVEEVVEEPAEEMAEEATEEVVEETTEEFETEEAPAEEPVEEVAEEVVEDAPAEEMAVEETEEVEPVDYEAMYSQLKAELEELMIEKNRLAKECEELNEFKASIMKEQHARDIDEVLEGFAELEAMPEYSALKEIAYGMTPDEVTSKCYELIGRMQKKFAKAPKATKTLKLPLGEVEDETKEDTPYGGLFSKFNK